MDNNLNQRYAALRRFNAVMAVLHLLQAVVMTLLSNDTTYPIYTNFLRFDPDTFTLVPDPKLAYELRFGPAVAAFLLISAIAHFSLATFGYKWYVNNLKKGKNPARRSDNTRRSSSPVSIRSAWSVAITRTASRPRPVEHATL